LHSHPPKRFQPFQPIFSLWTYTMNRCFPHQKTPRLRRIAQSSALLAGLTLASWGSFAQETVGRPFPPNAVRGILSITQPPDVLMDGKPDRLSPGARIRGANNMLVLSGTLMGQALRVNYTREPNGSIHQVWVLTDREAQRPAAARQP
jgi:hypothetical protein